MGPERQFPLTPPPPLPKPSMSSPRHPIPAPAESNSALKIVIAFLLVAVMGNWALTLYFNRSHQAAAAADVSVQDARAIEEMAHLKDDVSRTRAQLATVQAELGRIKVQNQTVLSQIAGVAPRPQVPYATTDATSVPEAASTPPQAPPPTAPNPGGQPK